MSAAKKATDDSLAREARKISRIIILEIPSPVARRMLEMRSANKSTNPADEAFRGWRLGLSIKFSLCVNFIINYINSHLFLSI